jgi:hypothetical protein
MSGKTLKEEHKKHNHHHHSHKTNKHHHHSEENNSESSSPYSSSSSSSSSSSPLITFSLSPESKGESKHTNNSSSKDSKENQGDADTIDGALVCSWKKPRSLGGEKEVQHYTVIVLRKAITTTSSSSSDLPVNFEAKKQTPSTASQTQQLKPTSSSSSDASNPSTSSPSSSSSTTSSSSASSPSDQKAQATDEDFVLVSSSRVTVERFVLLRPKRKSVYRISVSATTNTGEGEKATIDVVPTGQFPLVRPPMFFPAFLLLLLLFSFFLRFSSLFSPADLLFQIPILAFEPFLAIRTVCLLAFVLIFSS